MTSELRPAVEVYRDASYADAKGLGTVQSELEAAAVIEADREAVRAEQAPELARLKSLASDHFRNAERLARELVAANDKAAKWKALAETLAGALDGCVAQMIAAFANPDRLKNNVPAMDEFGDALEKAATALTSYKEQRDAS